MAIQPDYTILEKWVWFQKIAMPLCAPVIVHFLDTPLLVVCTRKIDSHTYKFDHNSGIERNNSINIQAYIHVPQYTYC